MPSKASTGVLVAMLAFVGASTFGCGGHKGLGERPTGGAGTTGIAGTGEPGGSTGAAGTFGGAGTTGAAGTVALGPLSGDWNKVEATPGCGHPAGLALGTFRRSVIQTRGTKPADCADARCGEWSYEREYYLRLPPDYDGNKPYPIVFEGPGCGGNGNTLFNNLALGNLAIRVGLSPPPNDIGHATNPNQHCFDEKEGDDSVDWVFYENLYDTLASHFCFDRNRVFAAGDSSGARMANELGCKYAGDARRPIRGVMTSESGLPDPKYQPTCTSKPLAGIWINNVGNHTNPFTETVTAIDRAASVSGCPSGTTYANAQFDPFPLGGDVTSCKRMKGCSADVPLVVCALPGSNSNGNNDNIVNPGWVAFLELFIPPPAPL